MASVAVTEITIREIRATGLRSANYLTDNRACEAAWSLLDPRRGDI